MNRVAYIGFTLAHMNGSVDIGKVVQLCLFHDIVEARVSDLNYLHQKYTERHEDKAVAELTGGLPFGDAINKLLDEYHRRESLEAKLAKDADNLELILTLKEQYDAGNRRAHTWLPSAVKRLKTTEGKKLGSTIIATDSDRWWFGDKEDDWWINRNNAPSV